MLVPVHPAASIPLGVVHVQATQSFDADDLVELPPCLVKSVLRHDVVAGDVDVARIEACREPFRRVDLLHHLRDVLEPVPNRRSLSGGGFERHTHVRIGSALGHRIQALRQPSDTLVVARAHVRAQVRDDVANAQRFGTIDLIKHRDN